MSFHVESRISKYHVWSFLNLKMATELKAGFARVSLDDAAPQVIPTAQLGTAMKVLTMGKTFYIDIQKEDREMVQAALNGLAGSRRITVAIKSSASKGALLGCVTGAVLGGGAAVIGYGSVAAATATTVSIAGCAIPVLGVAIVAGAIVFLIVGALVGHTNRYYEISVQAIAGTDSIRLQGTETQAPTA